MKKFLLYGICLSALVQISGCASIVNGTTQPVKIETQARGKSVEGANCKLVNDKGTWYVTTPGVVNIHRSISDLNLSCEKEGVAPGVAWVKSVTKAMAFGNIIFGGVIGATVDVANGAAFDYPLLMQVEMGSITSNLQSGTAAAVTTPSGLALTVIEPVPGKAQSVSVDAAQVQSTTGAPAYPYTLSGSQLYAHFQANQVLEMEASALPFRLKIHSDGLVSRECGRCNVQYGTGTMEIRQAESLVCFNWSVVTYPASGCFRVLRRDDNAFSLNALRDKNTYQYVVRR